MRGYSLCPIEAGDDAAARRIAADRSAHLCELAWDGHRVLVSRMGDDLSIRSADYQPWHALFAALAMRLRRLPVESLVLEGYLVGLDQRGQPSFARLEQMVAERDTREAVLVAWDLLHLDGVDLRSEPLRERRRQLAALLADGGAHILLSEALEGDLEAVRAGVAQLGIRGVTVRPLAAPYPPPAEAPWVTFASGDMPVTYDRSLSPPPAVTNADKVLYPRDGLAKKDIVAFYQDIAPVLLPYMRDRVVVAQRWPDGIDEFTWYQHRVPPRRHAPDYLKAAIIDGDRRLLVNDERSLLWLVNQAALTFHGWASRVGSLATPDWAIFDLDPGERTSWRTTIEVALALRRLLEMLELPSVVKTSGQKGLHVLVPLAPGQHAQTAHDFAFAAATMVARLFPDRVSLDPQPAARAGRLYLDHLQHYRGKMLVLPYSLRAADGAPVSTPVAWSEVTEALDPGAFNLRTLRDRLDRFGDLAAPLLAGTAQLGPAIERLAASGPSRV